MITRLKMNHQQAGEAVKNADLPGEITGASQAVAVILTQSWCPQWAFMNMSLQGLDNGPDDMDLTIFTYEYDLSPIFQEIHELQGNKIPQLGGSLCPPVLEWKIHRRRQFHACRAHAPAVPVRSRP